MMIDPSVQGIFSEAFAPIDIPTSSFNGQTAYISGDVVCKDTVQYGKFVSRVYIPNKKGTTAGFFTMHGGPFTEWNSVEIELVPSVDKHPMSLDLSYSDGTNRIQEQTYHQGDFFDSWHTYTIEWAPDYVSF